MNKNKCKRFFSYFGLLVIVNFTTNVFAKTNDVLAPFFVSNNLPVSTGVGLPKSLSAIALESGEKRLDINLGVKSNANDDPGRAGEILILDGETHSLDIGVEYGLNHSWQIDAQLSYLRHSSGNLDGLIQNWHDLIGLDGGDRSRLGRDNFLFSYTNNEVQNLIDAPVSGINDLRIGLGYQLQQNWVDNFMFRFGLSLPTGNAEKLIGSDKLDVDAGIYISNQGSQRWEKFGWHANLGYVFIGDDQALGIKTKSGTWFNSLGAYWVINSTVTLKGQLDSHGAFFQSDVPTLTRSTTELTLGLALQSKRFGTFDIHFSEDITVNRAADFSFGITKRITF